MIKNKEAIKVFIREISTQFEVMQEMEKKNVLLQNICLVGLDLMKVLKDEIKK